MHERPSYLHVEKAKYESAVNTQAMLESESKSESESEAGAGAGAGAESETRIFCYRFCVVEQHG